MSGVTHRVIIHKKKLKKSFQTLWVHENPLILKEMPAFPCLGVAALRRCGVAALHGVAFLH